MTVWPSRSVACLSHSIASRAATDSGAPPRSHLRQRRTESVPQRSTPCQGKSRAPHNSGPRSPTTNWRCQLNHLALQTLVKSIQGTPRARTCQDGGALSQTLHRPISPIVALPNRLRAVHRVVPLFCGAPGPNVVAGGSARVRGRAERGCVRHSHPRLSPTYMSHGPHRRTRPGLLCALRGCNGLPSDLG